MVVRKNSKGRGEMQRIKGVHWVIIDQFFGKGGLMLIVHLCEKCEIDCLD